MHGEEAVPVPLCAPGIPGGMAGAEPESCLSHGVAWPKMRSATQNCSLLMALSDVLEFQFLENVEGSCACTSPVIGFAVAKSLFEF